MRKQLLSFVLAVLMIASLLPATALAADIVDSGTCGADDDGSNLTWTLDSDGLLTISGTGAMEDYKFGSAGAPWADQEVKEVVIDDGVTSIGELAFKKCGSLTDVTISDSVTSIGENAFQKCTNLTSVSIPDGVTDISGVFIECTALTTVTLPGGVKDISYAFSGCSALTNITIPDGAEDISGAFSGCTALTKITIPRNVSTIVCAFAGCTSLTDIAVAAENPYFSSINGIVYSKDQKTIAAYPAGRPDTAYAIPAGVTCIGDGAFSGCANLTEVTIQAGMTSIGDSAFSECTNLTQVTIPKGVKSIGDSAFYRCTNLAQVSVPEGVTSISDYTFYACTGLSKITLPEGMISIGEQAFHSCTSLTEVTIPEGVTSIGDGAFSGDTTFEKVYEDGNTYLVQRVINMNLASITLPDSLTSIGNYAFQYCTKLESIVIPDNVTKIGDFGGCTFYGCTSLKSIVIPDGVTSIGDATFADCESLESVTLPDSVTKINVKAFSRCKSLKSIAIPNGVTEVVAWTFEYCESLESVTIPDTVTRVGGYAFSECNSLRDVYFLGAKDAWKKVTILWGNEAITENAAIHYLSEWTREKEPTCTEPGSETSTCPEADCGKTFTREIPALGHSWDEGKVTRPATDLEVGVKTFTCTRCGETKTEIIPKLPHEHSYKAVVTAPTCTEKGYTTHTCACGDSYVDTYTDALGHDLKADAANVPTCTTDGTTAGKHCTRCDYKEGMETVAALGHAWDNGKVTKPATETEDGVKTFTCTRCGETKTEVIPALSHKHSYKAVVTAPTCTEKGYTTHTCACGDSYVDTYIDALGHAWDGGKVTKPATETEDGVKTFTCTRCGETKTEVIPATGVVDVTEMFTDVSHSWADDGIQYCVTHKLMSGVGDKLFAPKATTTRAQIVQILYNLEGEPKVSGKTPFIDLTNDWYQDAILWAYQTGVVAGTSSTTFEPDRPVTREQIAVILMEYVTKVLKLERTWTPADLSAFPDAGSVSDWAKDAMADAVALGLISGASNGGQTYLEPQGSATREQVATILMEFCKNVKK